MPTHQQDRLDQQHPDTPRDTELSANLTLIHTAYDAFLRRDAAALLNVLAPDVQWVHPEGMATYGLGGTKVGHQGVTDFLATVPTVLGGMRLYPQEFIESGDRVVVFGFRDVTSASGRTERLKFVHSWTLSEGRATRMEDVFDTVLFHRLIES
ncbi:MULTISPECIES: nuclear transport factor 2 family protein [unclassified Streptomyces]|uniref:nuclear transport factor 2 family protein n=1 Tax=unclassified Streptomyces TaxID=2593676 RepID=UPI0037A6BD51